MAGIVGISEPNRTDIVSHLIAAVKCDGDAHSQVCSCNTATMGRVTAAARLLNAQNAASGNVVLDGEIYNWRDLCPEAAPTSPIEALFEAYLAFGPEFVKRIDGPFALAIAKPNGVYLARDVVGIAPLYYGFRGEALCYASCAKALMGKVDELMEFPPGHYYEPGIGLHQFADIEPKDPIDLPAIEIAGELRRRLVDSIAKRTDRLETGCWLSGGLDSSVMATLAARQVGRLKTFAVGMEGSPDLKFAKIVADFIGSEHREWIVTPAELLKVLPDVIYNLESFDALLVRSSMTNYLVAKMASEHVAACLSGEGGDELFAGYSYMKELNIKDIPAELIDITKRLHNTALQRVDRSSKAHGLVARVGFLDNDVIDYALRIPAHYKLYHDELRDTGPIEKWILRRAVDGLLPTNALERTKAKFWEGAGVKDHVAIHAEEIISDSEFADERRIADGQTLNTKEELFYYRIFREHFGDQPDASFVGRTKGAPVE